MPKFPDYWRDIANMNHLHFQKKKFDLILTYVLPECLCKLLTLEVGKEGRIDVFISHYIKEKEIFIMDHSFWMLNFCPRKWNTFISLWMNKKITIITLVL